MAGGYTYHLLLNNPLWMKELPRILESKCLKTVVPNHRVICYWAAQIIHHLF